MNTVPLWGLLLVIGLVGAQEYQDYYYPSYQAYPPPPPRLPGLRRLANRVDKIFQVPRGFWDGNFLRNKHQNSMTSRSLDEAEGSPSDMIGVRGNFDDLEKKMVPLTPALPQSSEIAPRRLPMQIMEENADFGPPIAPTQWQLMMAPFIMLMPDITEYCQCKGMANCGCCIGFYLKPFGLRNNLCVNMTLTKDAYTHSQFMVHAKMHYDNYKLMDFSVSEKQAPTTCVSVVPFSTVAGCVQVVDMHKDVVEDKMCSCMAVSLQYKDRSVVSLPSGCFCLGRPVPQSKKRGLFGIDFGSIFYSLQNMFLG